jgi:nucleotide-binding universal stress UspA family protein
MSRTGSGPATRPEKTPVNPTGLRQPVIIVGLDGSPTSWDAFAFAVGEAIRMHGTLTAVYATPRIEAAAAFAVPFDYAAAEQAWRDVAQELHDEADERVRGLGLQLGFVREHGNAAQALTRVARSTHADLIVVGKSTKILHHVAGSLGRRLMSKPDAPVIAVVP